MGDDTRRLWDAKHAYYCSESNYFASKADGGPFDFASWADFYEEFGDSDPDLNLVFRWDWHPPDEAEERDLHGLHVFFVGQRKGNFWCNRVCVSPDDEPAARAWLASRWAYLCGLWAPIADAATEGR